MAIQQKRAVWNEAFNIQAGAIGSDHGAVARPCHSPTATFSKFKAAFGRSDVEPTEAGNDISRYGLGCRTEAGQGQMVSVYGRRQRGLCCFFALVAFMGLLLVAAVVLSIFKNG